MLREVLQEFPESYFTETILALKLTQSTRFGAVPPQFTSLLRQLEERHQEKSQDSRNPRISLDDALQVIADIYGNNMDEECYKLAKANVSEWLPIASHSAITAFIVSLERTVLQHADTQFHLKFFVYFTDICISHALSHA